MRDAKLLCWRLWHASYCFAARSRTVLVRAMWLRAVLAGVLAFPAATAANSPPQAPPPTPLSGVQIAFLPDVHFHDVHGDVDAGSPTVATARQPFTGPALLRTMAAQLQSTRLFNENYYALKAALDDLVRRQVKLVVLPGDFSDDGQPVHVKGLAALLKRYQLAHGMRFLLTFGNHDPVTPFGQPAGKADFLGAQGQPLAIYSEGTGACPAGRLPADSPQLLCRNAVRELGYAELTEQIGAFGVMPQPADLYWETPFSQYPAGYSYASAKAQASISGRQSQMCRFAQPGPGSGQSPGQRQCAQLPDTSYLVEPLPGLWLLALDANVYLPNADGGFSGSGNAGYNALLVHKPYLTDWIADVVARAKAQQKTLMSFSHFPMSAFYQGQELKLTQLLSDESAAGNSGAVSGKAQLARLPSADTSQTLAALGLTLHIGGHMHLNNTAFIPAPRVAGQPQGKRTQLVNVQAPSLAAYRPAYKLLTLENARQAHLQSIELRDVPGFNQQFGRYQQEWQQRAKAGLPLWDRAVLDAKNYGELTDWHLRELVRSRFLPKDWPAPLRALLQQLNGQQLLLLALSPGAVQVPAGQMPANEMPGSDIPLKALADTTQLSARLQPHWQSPAGQALARRLAEQAQKAGLDWPALAHWQGDALALDLYRLQNAGALALADISQTRLAQYRFMATQLAAVQPTSATQSTAVRTTSTADTVAAYSRQKLTLLLEIVTAMAAAPAYDDFRLDLTNGAVLSPAAGDLRQSAAR